MNVGRRDCIFRHLPKELGELIKFNMESPRAGESLIPLYDNFGKLVSKTNYIINKDYRFRVEE